MANNEYDKLKSNNKDITPHYDDIKSEHKLRLRDYVNKYEIEKKKGYTKIGYDEAKAQLTQWFDETINICT